MYNFNNLSWVSIEKFLQHSFSFCTCTNNNNRKKENNKKKLTTEICINVLNKLVVEENLLTHVKVNATFHSNNCQRLGSNFYYTLIKASSQFLLYVMLVDGTCCIDADDAAAFVFLLPLLAVDIAVG